MLATEIPGANATLGPPKDWNKEKNGECGSLNVIYDSRKNTFTSAWKPSKDELEVLMAGGFVSVCIYSNVHPAISIGVASEIL